jgi:multidrug efflux pump
VRGSAGRLRYYGIAYVLILVAWPLFFLRLPSCSCRPMIAVLCSAAILAAGATLERSRQTTETVRNYFLNEEKENVDAAFTINGFSFVGRGQNQAMAFVNLKDWSEREGPGQAAEAIAGRAMGALSGIKDAMVFTILPPSVPGLGTATGFDLQLIDRGGLGHAALLQARNQLLGMAAQNPLVAGVRPNGLDDTAQFHLEVDREKARALGLRSAPCQRNALSTALGGNYIQRLHPHNAASRRSLCRPTRRRSADAAPTSTAGSPQHAGGMVPFFFLRQRRVDVGLPKLERYTAARP